MLPYVLAVVVLVSAAALLGVVLFIRWGKRWGARSEECAGEFTIARFLGEGRGVRAVCTRAITIGAPPEIVWPWLAQVGRGAGFYSYDWLDNDRKASAEHIVSWIPEPKLGDAVAFGYLRHLEPGRELVWWIEECSWLGATWRGGFQYCLKAEDGKSRLVARVVCEARGGLAWAASWAFTIIDSIMMRRQFLELKKRAEKYGARREDPEHPETGARDQFQGPVVLYASGERAGSSGEKEVLLWRQAAIAAGVLLESPAEGGGKLQG
jgi:hypothetical protein